MQKIRFKRETGVYIPIQTEQVGLVSLKSQVDKLKIDQLKATPADLCKISNIVENDVFKTTAYEKSVAKA